jgi:hypothetical protein
VNYGSTLWIAGSAADKWAGKWAWRPAAAGGAAAAVRVVSYNLLSDSLCDEADWTFCKPEDVDDEARLGLACRFVLLLIQFIPE